MTVSRSAPACPAFDAVLRGLAGGVAAHFVAWIAGIVAWRHLVLAELAAHREAQEAKLRAHHEAAERRAAEALAAQRVERVAIDPIRPIGPRPDLAPVEPRPALAARARGAQARARGAPPPAPREAAAEPPADADEGSTSAPEDVRAYRGSSAQVRSGDADHSACKKGATRSRPGPSTNRVIKER